MKRKAPEPALIDPADAPQRIGYARVSTDEQDVDHQVQALKAAGCDHIYTDIVSGRSKKRKVLSRLLRDLRPQDTLIVTQLDRVARNIRQFYEIMDSIYGAKATFKSLKEDFDFNKSIGRFIIGILALVAQFEADLISDRTKSGMAAAKARGSQVGQPEKFTKDLQRKAAKLMRERRWNPKWKKRRKRKGSNEMKWVGRWENRWSIAEIAAKLDISVSSIHNKMKGGRAKHGRTHKVKTVMARRISEVRWSPDDT